MIQWSAENNSNFLNGYRLERTLRGAVKSARYYLKNELYGEGIIYYFDDNDLSAPIRTDEKSIFTKFQWKVTK